MLALLSRPLAVLALLAAVGVGVWFYGETRYDAGRRDFASELAVTVAEKRADDAETLEEITNEIAETADDDLVGIIIDGGWLLPD